MRHHMLSADPRLNLADQRAEIVLVVHHDVAERRVDVARPAGAGEHVLVELVIGRGRDRLVPIRHDGVLILRHRRLALRIQRIDQLGHWIAGRRAVRHMWGAGGKV
jgi:hypothetical protein